MQPYFSSFCSVDSFDESFFNLVILFLRTGPTCPYGFQLFLNIYTSKSLLALELFADSNRNWGSIRDLEFLPFFFDFEDALWLMTGALVGRDL